jgi:hypothetical protein
VETHAPEFDSAARLGRGKRRRYRRRSYLRTGVEHLEQPRHGRCAALEEIDHPPQRNERPGEQGQVEAERHEGANRDRSLDGEPPAKPEHDGDTEPREQPEERIHRAVQPRERHVALEIRLVERREPLDLRALLPVGAHHPHAGEVLLRLGGESAELFLDRLEPRVDASAQDDHHDRQEDHRQERQEGEAQVDAQHEDERERSAEDRVGQVHDRRAGGHADRTKVVRQPRHDVAGPRPREVPRVERGEVREEGLPQVVLDVSAEPVEDLAHPEAKRAAAQRDRDDADRDPRDACGGRAGREIVDPGAQQPRDDRPERGRDDHEEKTDHQHPAVWAVVRQQAAHGWRDRHGAGPCAAVKTAYKLLQWRGFAWRTGRAAHPLSGGRP